MIERREREGEREKKGKRRDIEREGEITMSRNYEEKLLQEIITGNYELVYQSRGKCEIYRDTGVSKNGVTFFIQC